jgi:hypothetical protein
LIKKMWFALPAVLIIAAGTIHATPVACTPNVAGTLTTVVGTAPGTSMMTLTCSSGGTNIIFSNFQAIDASGGTTTGLLINYIAGLGNTYIDTGSGIVNLSLNPNFPSVGAKDIHYTFDVVSSVALTSVDMSVGGAGTGTVTIDEVVCSGGTANMNLATGGCINGSTMLANMSQAANSSTPGGQQLFTPPGATSMTLGVFKDIGATNGEGLTSFTQSFHFSTVPEPATFALMGAGLILFAVSRRKRA